MKQFQALIVQEGIFYVAKNLELGVVSQGKTLEESVNNLKEATQLFLEDESDMAERNPGSPAYLTTISV